MITMVPRHAGALAAVFLLVLFVGVARMSGIDFSASPSPQPQQSSFSKERLENIGTVIRAFGYSCKTPVSMRGMLTTASGFVVHCYGDHPNSQYWFDVEDRGGIISVSPR